MRNIVCLIESISKHGFDSANYSLLLDRVSLAFHATRCCTGSTFCNRAEHYYVAWAYGVVHKRSAAARRSVPFVSRNLSVDTFTTVRC